MKNIYLTDDDISLIDEVLASIPKDDGTKLKNLSYKTEPLKRLGVKLGDGKCMGEVLKLV
jgi:hypothetical protein